MGVRRDHPACCLWHASFMRLSSRDFGVLGFRVEGFGVVT